MDYGALDALILKHEGKRYDVYDDGLGNLTVGIGHKVLPGDNLNAGDVISEDRVQALYLNDRANAIQSVKNIFPDFDTYPSNIQLALVDMMFNWGETKFRQAPDTINLIKSKNWPAVASKLGSSVFSTWRSEVGARATDLINMFKSPGGITITALLVAGILGYFLYKYFKSSPGISNSSFM
jgi:GH24 family phage-related lysozyme (muramidase)